MTGIFIVGCPRSGTTLIQSLIGAHPDVATFPETHFFDFVVARHPIARFLGIASLTGRQRYENYAAKVCPELSNTTKAFFMKGCAYSLVEKMEGLANAQGKSTWLEKTPKHLHFIPEITRYVKDAKFVHVIRHGLPTIASLLEVSRTAAQGWEETKTLEDCLQRWERDVAISLGYKGQPNHCHVLFERLTENPQIIVDNLLKRLNLSATDDDGLSIELHEQIVSVEETWKVFRPVIEVNHGKAESVLTKGQRKMIGAAVEHTELRLSQEFTL